MSAPPSSAPFWLSAFLDYPAAAHHRGEDYLRLQRRQQGPTRIHLDLHVADVGGATGTAEALGATVVELETRREFAWLRGPRSLALDVLVQRLEVSTSSTTDSDEVTEHLDVGTTDRAAEVARHRALGATPRTEKEFWTVLADPVGLVYCVTDRDPATGRLP